MSEPAGTNLFEDESAVTYDVHISFDEEGEPKSWFTVVGVNSQQYRDAVRKSDISGVQRAHRDGRQIRAETKEGAAMLVDGAERREMAIACGCTVGLHGILDKAGAPVEFNAVVIKEIFEKKLSWRRKVVAAIETERNFTKG